MSRHVRILMCTRDGAAHLEEQLASFAAQSHGDWSLWVSDDGSRDATLRILEGFRRAHPGHDVELFDGPRQGVAANCFSLLARVTPDPGMLVALSDQDDVWLPDKLARAAAAVAAAEVAAGRPVVYGAAYVLADESLGAQRPCRPFSRGPSFANALVQNVLSGHSLTLNAAALALLLQGLPRRGVPYHDWWIYQLITGAGGVAVYDPAPALIYRQHGGNAIGGNRGPAAVQRRAMLLNARTYRQWIGANIAALQSVERLLTPENRTLLRDFAAARQRAGPLRAWRWARLGIHRQRPAGTLALLAAALLGRV